MGDSVNAKSKWIGHGDIIELLPLNVELVGMCDSDWVFTLIPANKTSGLVNLVA
ncbi:hypothetical protein [Shewanella sp. YLB-07]|uniref:hypothetical protein n=1 Tax=Shewanella sp. YLB-07 TaxID=2601268 RepID=UPI001D13ED79|nr:hypothetical protein [Shewanella sp. YLB-07]